MPNWFRDFLAHTFPNVDAYAVLKNIFYIILTLILARVAFWFFNAALRKIFTQKTSSSFLLVERRAKTLYPLLRSILFYTISFFAVLNILSLIGISTTTILASASILGLAVGFGAQSLVKDIISGFFIIFEDQFAVGEFVRTDKYEGIVEEIGLRATKLRDWGGELHIIPNGTIASVTNFNRGKMRSMVDINVPYDDDIEKAMDIIGQIGKEMAEEFKNKLVEAPKVQGIINLGEAFVVIRMIAYTQPMEQWEMEREMRRRVVRALTKAGIRVPALRKVFVEKG